MMKRKRYGRWARDMAVSERAQASFELLLILPIFLGFLLLMVDFGLLMYQYVTVANGAREGARYGAVGCLGGACDDTAISQVVADSAAFVALSDVHVSWRDNNSSGNTNPNRGDSVIVRIDHQYNFLFVPGAHIKVVSCADMRLESDTAPTGLAPGGAHCDGS